MTYSPTAALQSLAVPVASRDEADRRARQMEMLGHIESERCRRALLYYLERYCYTVDEHNRDEPVQRLIHGDYAIDPVTLQLQREVDGREDDFLRFAALYWEREPLIAFPKSRQMRLTHLCVAMHGWLARYWSGQRIAVQSKNFEDADALLERLHQSWIVQAKLAPHLPRLPWTRKVGRIICPNGSIIMAIAQGADKLRSYTFSAILSDEMAFQALAEDAYTAAVPTIEGGGKYTAVSSANPGFFQQIVFDKAGAS